MNLITILPQDVCSGIFSYLKPKEHPPLMEVHSTWYHTIQEVLKRRLWLDYAPLGEDLNTYQDKHYVGSTQELKGRVRLFIKQLIAQEKRGVFICVFPLNNCPDNSSPWLAIKWNPKREKDASDAILMDDGFYTPSLQDFQPYLLGKKFSNNESKLAIKVCLAVKKLKENSKVLESSFSTAPNFISTVNGGQTFIFYSGHKPQEVHKHLLGEIESLFCYDKRTVRNIKHSCASFVTAMICAVLYTTSCSVNNLLGRDEHFMCHKDMTASVRFVIQSVYAMAITVAVATLFFSKTEID